MNALPRAGETLARNSLAVVLLAVLPWGFAVPFHAQPVNPEPPTRTLAEFPNGTFLENIAPLDDGAFAFTSYFDKRLMRLDADGSVTEIAALPDHPVGLVRVENGFVVSAHGTPFSDAPAFTSTNKVLLLDMNGSVRVSADAPDALFLNGLVVTEAGEILVADSLAATIWEIDPESGSLSPWLQAEALSPDPDQTVFRPGANGLKTFDGTLHVSNSSREMLYRVEGEDASRTVATHATTGPVDDFVFTDDGTIYATTHGDAVLRVEPDGTISTLLEKGCDGCTSIVHVASDNGDRLLYLATGKLLEGGDGAAKIVEIDLAGN